MLDRFGGADRFEQSSLDTRKLERHGGYDRLGDASTCLVKPRYGGTAEPLRHRAAWHRVEVGDAFQTKPRGGDKRFRRQPQCRERRSEEHTSELQSLMRISYAVFCLKKKHKDKKTHTVDNKR